LPACSSSFKARLLQGKFDLALLLSVVETLHVSCRERSLDTERLQTLDYLGANSTIDPHPTEGNAPIAAVIDLATAAVVAPRATILATVSDVEFATAMAAAKNTGEQGLAASHRTPTHEALAIGVVSDQTLIPLELGPANVTLVMVEDQSLPLTTIFAESAHDPLATALDRDAAAGAAENVCPSIDRVCQYVVDRIVDRELPLDVAAVQAITHGGQRQALVAKPQMNLTQRLHLGELAKDEGERLLDAPIRVLVDLIVGHLHVTDGHREEQFSAPRLLLQRLQRPLTEDRELHLAHRALHTEQQPIVGMARVIDAILIDDERSDETAELK
jgi:hypothetical protein